ncbi:MAG: NAD(P)-dependent glycerol-3-phosphate dehydrogenase [Chlamydiales bacterium]|nr:NAD(P)-dependent glycerol-3-phosphate dehydrogenase [Chlamydiales bacterium]
MKITYLGAGAWGFCLARLLAEKGHDVTSWSIDKQLVETLNKTQVHPHLKGRPISKSVRFTSDLQEAIVGAELVVESVTSAGLRPVCKELKALDLPSNIPFCLTSKGIEQNSGLILPEVLVDVMGSQYQNSICSFSGPSFAEEVSQNLPTSVVAGAYDPKVAEYVAEAFTTSFLRVYPNRDIRGVAFGGALKNIIAIACGISDGLNLGNGARAALMTRGLHEIVKLAKHFGAKQETLYGLSGMGDLFLTCSSSTSRNYSFGKLLSAGSSATDAKKSIEMVVEGAYTCVSAVQLGKKANIDLPISEAVLQILEGKLQAKDAVGLLMQRLIKEESL